MTDEEGVFTGGVPSCSDCGSTDIEAMFSEEGQYKGSWCEDCGSMSYGSMSISPSFYKIQQEFVKGLKEKGRGRIYDVLYDAIVEYCTEEGIDQEYFSDENIQDTVEEFLDNAFEGFEK